VTKIETVQLREHPRLLWVQLHTDAGLVGLGETYYAPSVVAAAVHDYFGPLLIGRDPAAIERTAGIGTVFIRDDRAEAERLFREASKRNRISALGTDQPVGTPEDVAEQVARYIELGYLHLIAGVPAAYDEESMTRFATEVKPLLERSASTAVAS
jgi:L-alanine-DL-glutamate epimerase-like enolase superfamily enzyme